MNTPIEPRLVLNMAACRRCWTVVISATVHDFRICRCGAIHIDGGLEYLKRGGSGDDIVDLSVRLEPDGKLTFVEEPPGLFETGDFIRWFKHADGPWHATDLDRSYPMVSGDAPLVSKCGAIIYPCNLPPRCQVSMRMYNPGRICLNCARALPDCPGQGGKA